MTADGHLDADGAVVPVGNNEIDDPWRALGEGSGLLVTWRPREAQISQAWGPALKGSSALAQQLTQVAARAGASSAVTAGSALFRIELPTGATLQNLVPAVGGGFRGLVRGASSPSITGQARLIPVAGGTVGGIALGPLVGLMALSVGTEMLARHQQDKKLVTIRSGVQALNAAVEGQALAQLDGAAEALELGAAAILDRAEIPSSVGIGAARDNIRTLRIQGLQWLESWSNAINAHPFPVVGLKEMKGILGAGAPDHRSFGRRVELIYQALVLDARATVLTAAEASLRNSEGLPRLEAQLQRELARGAADQQRFIDVMWELAERQVTFGLPARDATRKEAVALGGDLLRMAKVVGTLPEAPGLLTSTGRQVLEVVKHANGDVHVLPPGA